jgi:hypothetical protein
LNTCAGLRRELRIAPSGARALGTDHAHVGQESEGHEATDLKEK